MGCMEDGLSVWVGCERWEMTTLSAGFERRCIHERKEGKEAVFFWRLAEEAETKMKRRHWEEGELTVESARFFWCGELGERSFSFAGC